MNKSNKMLIIFCGPSGVGKGTIERYLFNNKQLKLALSISVTSRLPREGEIEGIHYFFISKEEFKQKIRDNKLIEYSKHFNNYYGTLKEQVDTIITNGSIPFLEIETNGARKIIEENEITNEYDIISIFVHAPDMKELESRIRNRNTESEENIRLRLEKAKSEIGESGLFQYHVTNHTPEQAANEISKIIIKHIKVGE
ncbi:guanylate kinase [Mycoplasma phocimorsus]|uniref:Guanylate kinase n=1 Tax=Mycoplasma phocimorsus TaxID=3045839 RepID=A0AAJ1UWU8_9MOLU|nr:guanylate kinase [Mycoplasma phocimorsus]MDJ1645840.1 guanylate kinase [Mycoplasma phocimorsus]MDJ1646428.1 guanylate kinase [Mycoplasma phocimorsus]MDJ1647008.1 guanylate kinase [Mycoplasma phocimorsus]MDJ1647455.1 guanylate kinase [Mycoplasma phocimorsus]MDJ1648013.1 guanylate kinase [Mycoplasma phocimorsus]